MRWQTGEITSQTIHLTLLWCYFWFPASKWQTILSIKRYLRSPAFDLFKISCFFLFKTTLFLRVFLSTVDSLSSLLFGPGAKIAFTDVCQQLVGHVQNRRSTVENIDLREPHFKAVFAIHGKNPCLQFHSMPSLKMVTWNEREEKGKGVCEGQYSISVNLFFFSSQHVCASKDALSLIRTSKRRNLRFRI